MPEDKKIQVTYSDDLIVWKFNELYKRIEKLEHILIDHKPYEKNFCNRVQDLEDRITDFNQEMLEQDAKIEKLEERMSKREENPQFQFTYHKSVFDRIEKLESVVKSPQENPVCNKPQEKCKECEKLGIGFHCIYCNDTKLAQQTPAPDLSQEGFYNCRHCGKIRNFNLSEYFCCNAESDYPEEKKTKTYWVNVYKHETGYILLGQPHDSEKKCDSFKSNVTSDFIKTISFEIEEDDLK
jgi:hypothetical protein